MKANVTRGANFGQIAEYVAADGDDERIWIGGTAAGETVAETTAKFSAVDRISRHPNARNLVLHASLSLPSGDTLPDEKWNAIGRDFLSRMGMDPDNHLHAIARHTNTAHEHVHVVASRLGSNGELWRGGRDSWAAMKAAQDIEREHGLTITEPPRGPDAWRSDYVRLEKWEKNWMNSTGKEVPKITIARAVREEINAGDGSLETLATSLHKRGVDMRIVEDGAGRAVGVSFADTNGEHGHAFGGGQIGPGYRFDSVKKRLNERAASLGQAPRYHPEPASMERAAGAGSDPAGAQAIQAWYARHDHPRSLTLKQEESGVSYRAAGGGKIIDTGRRLELKGMPGDQAVSQLVEVAKARGWESARVTGSATFRARAEVALNRAGIRAEMAPEASPVGSEVKRVQQTSRQQPKGRQTPRQTPGRKDIEAQREAERRERADAWARAKQTSPADYLRGRGYAVKETSGGRRLEARASGDHVSAYYGEQRGQWFVARGPEVSGSVDFVMREEGLSTATMKDKVKSLDKAAELLTGKSISQAAVSPAPAAPERKPSGPLTLPRYSEQDAERGRQYLQGRGVARPIIMRAEKQGAISYGRDHVTFVGRDMQGQARYAARRYYQDRPDPDKPGKTYNKRDMPGSDKSYPFALSGFGQAGGKTLHLVEGGTDALALQSLANAKAPGAPEVMTTGGGNTARWLERESVRDKVRDADRIVIWREREKSAEVQAKMDAAHDKQLQRIEAVRGHLNGVESRFPERGKDIGQQAEIQAKERAEKIRERGAEVTP